MATENTATVTRFGPICVLVEGPFTRSAQNDSEHFIALIRGTITFDNFVIFEAKATGATKESAVNALVKVVEEAFEKRKGINKITAVAKTRRK